MKYPGEIRITRRRGGIVLDIDGIIGAKATESDADDTEQKLEQNDDSPDKAEEPATYAGLRRRLDRAEIHADMKVKINIRSVGGCVGEAVLIYDYLCELAATGVEITTLCHGYTASAATIVAQAAAPGRRMIAPEALYLIHNSTARLEGNCLDARNAAVLLDKTDSRIAEIYAGRSGRPVAEFIDLMGRDGGRGEWLTPEEAVGVGLADGVAEGGSLLLEIGGKVRNFFSRKTLLKSRTSNETARVQDPKKTEGMRTRNGATGMPDRRDIRNGATGMPDRRDIRNGATGMPDRGDIRNGATGGTAGIPVPRENPETLGAAECRALIEAMAAETAVTELGGDGIPNIPTGDDGVSIPKGTGGAKARGFQTAARAQAVQMAALAEHVVRLQRQAETLAGENLRLLARPSATLPREDPDPMPLAGLGDTPPDGNHSAYADDVQLFREGRGGGC